MVTPGTAGAPETAENEPGDPSKCDGGRTTDLLYRSLILPGGYYLPDGFY